MYWKLEERESLLYNGRNLSRIVSCGYVESRTYNKEVGYLAEIFEPSVKVCTGYFLLLMEKCERKKINLREELLNKKEARFDD